jgi:hypothetical protein
MTITIVIVLCWILYRTGKTAEMLEAFRLYPTPTPAAAPPESPPRQPTPTPKVKTELPTLERMQKEAIAMNILSYNQIENAAELVKRLSDSEIQDIITRFMDDLEV